MRLLDNKIVTIDIKLYNRHSNVEDNVWDSNYHIRCKEDIWVLGLVSSNFLTYNIYDEIRRE